MRILSGYLPATSGTAKVAGYEVHDNSLAVRKRIGYLPETPPLYPEMTVEGFLHFVARIKGVSPGDRARNVQSALEKTNLTEKRHTLIRKLSKGYRQRVGIAQAIVHDPPVIILDEPTVGLDPRQIIEVRHLIKNLAGNHTVILSTHILPEVSMTCNRVAILNKGRIVVTNTPEGLQAQLAGGSGYELDVEGDETLLKEKLQAIPAIHTIDSVRAELPPGRHQIRVLGQSGTTLSGQDIAAAIVRAGLGLHEMRRIQVSLEDVFLQLTTEEPPIPPDTPDNPEAPLETSPNTSPPSPSPFG
jgi:ABC-2 type transport system ATP-binding protein